MHRLFLVFTTAIALAGVAAAEPPRSTAGSAFIGPPKPRELGKPTQNLDLQLKPTSPLFRPSGRPDYLRPAVPDLQKSPVGPRPEIRDKLNSIDSVIKPIKPFSIETKPGGGMLKYRGKW